MYFKNEVGPGVLQLNVQETCVLRESQTKKTKANHTSWPKLCVKKMAKIWHFREFFNFYLILKCLGVEICYNFLLANMKDR